jgi:hypothetical protein
MLLLIVTLASTSIAAVMSFVAWRVAGEERRRSDARVDALAAEIHGSVSTTSGTTYTVSGDLELRPVTETTLPRMFAGQQAGAPSRLAAVVGVSVLLCGGVAALAMVVTASAPGVTRGRGVASTPLELVSLGQERDGDTLTVSGVVRNPLSGARLNGLTAVVFLFTPDGGFLTSGRAAIAPVPFGPGRESRFVVSVPGATDVGRFRVSFRVDDRVVPHVDKRESRK